MVQILVRQAVPLQPMEVHDGAEIHLQPKEDPNLEQKHITTITYLLPPPNGPQDNVYKRTKAVLQVGKWLKDTLLCPLGIKTPSRLGVV
ncbi:hypothetical protein WISP_106033 [Willisornis vidua]|uniref:Uncharacterized protein n=1 Tax=Willisornis vidua TaxID=1566151 RepID=A0ABQ9CX88_9PASS|nr:hypothetical protein WISP_106033 [Willisornis vidua]